MNRGILLGPIATAVPVPAMAMPSQEHPDQALLQLCQEFHLQWQRGQAVVGTDDAADAASGAAYDARWAAADAMQLLRPQTEEGRAAKAGVAVTLLLSWFDPGDDAHVDFALDTLRDLIGQPESATA